MMLKEGVRVLGIRPELTLAMMICEQVLSSHNKELVITSCIDGKHSIGSLHYAGAAFDVRIWYMNEDEQDTIVADLQEALGDDFDVVLESTHIHVEFQPKAAY